MSFGLGHGRALDPGLGVVGISDTELGPMPDDFVTNPGAGHVDPRGWFAKPDRPFEIEIGSGKGTFLIQQAGIEPETNFLGIEWAGEFYAYAADRIRRRREAGKLLNVRMLNTDATEFLRWRCPSGIVRVIHLYFSDPWPKNRHHKKRVIQHAFLAHAWRVLAPGGELRVVTDHDGLWAWDLAHFAHWVESTGPDDVPPLPSIPAIPNDIENLRNAMPVPAFAWQSFDRPESARAGEVVGTNFERKFRVEGREFHVCVLKRLGAGS